MGSPLMTHAVTGSTMRHVVISENVTLAMPYTIDHGGGEIGRRTMFFLSFLREAWEVGFFVRVGMWEGMFF